MSAAGRMSTGDGQESYAWTENFISTLAKAKKIIFNLAT
jgi:hypothetical protein